jgi:hypothetical protein
MSRFDTTSALVGLVKMRGNQVDDTVALVGRVVIIHALVRRLFLV